MNPPLETCVAVIGAGPAGLMSALLLARAGVPCAVFEQHEGISTHPKAMGITRRSAEIFRQLGLLDRMQEADFSTAETQLMIWAKALVGEELGRAPLPAADVDWSPCRPFHSPQTHTEAVLLAALEAEPLARVHFRHRVRTIGREPHAVELDVSGPEGGFICRAEWVIAADGAGSPVRRILGIQAEGPGDLGHFLNVFFHADPSVVLEGRRSLLYNILREDLVEFLVSVNGRDLWLMHHFLQPGEDATRLSPEVLEGMIRAAMGLPDLRVQILGRAPWVMSPKVATAFRNGRIFLVGDAASRLSPAGGLGMNTGLQSAHNLAWKLAAVVHGHAGEGLLDTYEKERRSVSLGVMHHTNENSGEVLRQVDCALRGAFDELKTMLAASHRHEEDRRFDTGIEYSNGPRFPHAWVRVNGQRLSTLDLVGGSFVVLAGPRAQVPKDALYKVVRPECEDASFAAAWGLDGEGAILVRPDGFVAGRVQGDPATVTAALRVALSGG
ncbi:MAG: FAD-dependent monooxygenase [Terrimicrobiaceae bacterium]|nr:FAD-dependent monooxygenase [Terrimicrobiaceae bacterium]